MKKQTSTIGNLWIPKIILLQLIMIFSLISAGGQSSSNLGVTLINAAKFGETEKAKQLISKGADLNVKDYYGCTALMEASSKGHLEIVKDLIVAGAEVNEISNTGFTALIFASRSGKINVVQELIASDAIIETKTNDGNTALSIAKSKGYIDITNLLERGLLNRSEITHVDLPKNGKIIYYEITRNGNVRSGPSTQHKIIGKVTVNMIVQQIEKAKDWSKVKLPNQEIGWIHKILIDKATNLDEVDNEDTNVKSNQFFAIPEIKPVGTTLLESELKPSDVSGYADQSMNHNGHDQKFISRAFCFYLGPDNLIIAALKGDFPIGQSATKLCKEIPSSETTINSSYTVWQTEYGGLVLSTENEEDKLYYYFNGNNMVRIYPFGDGAFISFKGKVVDFFEGYTFEGNEVNPLRFELSSKTGLTFISGSGSILKENRLLKKF